MTHGCRVLTLVAGLALLSVTGAAQAGRALTLDVIYGVGGRADFSGSPDTALTWLDDRSYLTTRRSPRGAQWVRVDAATGAETLFLDQPGMETALAALPDVGPAPAAVAAWSARPVLNAARTAALVTLGGNLYHHDFAARRATRLTQDDEPAQEALFSPDGRHVAFVRGNNLHMADVETGRVRALTSDGSEEILNGRLDWLYQEEIYGRGRFRSFWWSPDSSRLAFLRLDQHAVPTYTLIDDVPYRPDHEVMRYPKAGDPNPGVRLGVVATGGDAPVWVDLEEYAGNDILIVDVGWTPDSRHVVHQVQDREQVWLDLRLADVEDGAAVRILRETTPAWVDPNGSPHWLEDGSFLWVSERTGFRHLYRHTRDGAVRDAVTAGRWDVRTLYGVDERNGWVYVAADERSPTGTDVYRVRLDGTGLERLSQAEGTHRAIFSPGFSLYAGIWNDLRTPTQVRLHRADGALLRVIDANPVPALAEFRLSAPELVQVPARDGYPLNGVLIRPPDFDPQRRYPVYQFTYGGPGAAQARNAWGGVQYIFHQLLAQHGFVVWILDNRSAGGQGVESQWPIYGRLGEQELRDLEDGFDWLAGQPYIDASRAVLSGWSYGGFMTAYALTHSTRWSAGIAGAPVTDWRDYDTVYTERYMRMPQRNDDGYRRTAPRLAADRLRGRLLLVHGALDDNVHPQNTMQFAYELQRAGRPFEMMLYPRSRHAIGDPRQNRHVRQLMLDFALRAAGLPAS